MTDRADPHWDAAVAGLPSAARAALAADPPAAPTRAADPVADLLSAALPPIALPPVHAADLSPRELHALAVCGGPDVALVDCPPGTDRPAFAAAVALEAVRRGERVAVLTGSAADADAVLARLLDQDLVVGRAAGPGEPPDPDHGAAAHAAADAARRRLFDHLHRRQTELAAARAAADALPRLHALADRLAALAAEAGALKADPLARPDEARDAELAAIDATYAAERLKLAAKPAGLLGAVKGFFAKPDADRQAGFDAAHQEARRQLVAAAADRHHAELLAHQAATLDEFRAAARPVTAAGLTPPAGPTPAALEPVAAAVARLHADAESAADAAQHSLDRFDARRPHVERALCGAVPAVVGPASACASDPLLAGRFDRLIVAAADATDDATLNTAAGSAGRWVLLGDAAPPAPAHRNGKSGSFHRPTLFRRLWDRLAAPPVWSADGPLLVASVLPHDPAGGWAEPLADRPQVELRFTRAGDLAAVAFPPTATLADAKAVLAAELGHHSPAGCGPHVWHDDPDRLAACWPAVDPDGGDWADLGGGVRELVCGTGPDGLTAQVTFDRSAGWTRAAAEAWLADRLPPCRVARLPAPVLVAG